MRGINSMKIFEIIDEENSLSIGVLLYYEREKTFIIELREGLDEWNAPLLLTSYVNKGILTIPRDISKLWVKERIIPSGRQNIQSILKTHHLKEYDEMKFLELSKGRCSQDSLYIEKLNDLPAFVVMRQARNLTNCTILEGLTVLCFFADDTVKKINLTDLDYVSGIDKIIDNYALFSSCKIGTGGYFMTFNDSIDIPCGVLYDSGIPIPFKPSEFLLFIKNNLADTTECCNLLECTRQNLAYMVKQGQITPVIENIKGNIYSKGDIQKNLW